MTEINTDDEIENKMKDVKLQDTPKIPVRQRKYYFTVIDTLTDTIIGTYESNQEATKKILHLVENDLEFYILHLRTSILLGTDVAENREKLKLLKTSIYHLRTLEQSRQTTMTIEGKNISRYAIRMSHDMMNDEQEAIFL